MTRRHLAIATFFLVAAGAFTVALAQPTDRRGRVADDETQADMPAPPLRVHEWGVWRIRNGRVDHLAELTRENPQFVHRANQAATAPLTPRYVPPEMMIADKPVIFLYAGTALDVQLTVEFASGGEPWFYYPAATAGVTEAPARRTVRWQGHVTPQAVAPSSPLAPASPRHFWSALRNVGASAFRSSGSTESERFLFYDGPTTFPRVLDIVASGGRTQQRRRIRDSQGEQVWVTGGGSFEQLGMTGQGTRTNRTMPELERQLRAALVARGLSAAEATSLLDTWRGDLFRRTERRAIYFLPRSAYDTMLPITVLPRPIEITRVGLVIQMLQ